MFTSVMLFVFETLTFIIVVGIAWWAFSSKRNEEFERAAMLPFEFDSNPRDMSGRNNG